MSEGEAQVTTTIADEAPDLASWSQPPPPARTPVDTGAPGKGPYRLIGDLDIAEVAIADAGGIARIVIGPVPSGQRWDFGRAAVTTDSAAVSELRVFTVKDRNEEPPPESGLLDGSTSGNLDIADNAAAWRVETPLYLLLRWTGATPGALCRARLQGDALTTA